MTRRAAVIGLGERGAGWVGALLDAGWSVTGFDPDPAARILQAARRDWRRRDTISAAVAGADWVVLCLPERLELLRKVMERAQAESREDAVFAVETGTFAIEELQGCALRPGFVLRVETAPDGAIRLDLSAVSAGTVRASAEIVLAEIAAHRSLQPLPLQADQPPEAESA